jgi:hypothetical protein
VPSKVHSTADVMVLYMRQQHWSTRRLPKQGLTHSMLKRLVSNGRCLTDGEL